MSKLMLILGIVVTAAAIALGLLVFFSPGEMQIRGLTHEVVAILLVGGIVFIGMGGIIGAVERSVEATADLRRLLGGPDLPSAPVPRPSFRPEAPASTMGLEPSTQGSPVFGKMRERSSSAKDEFAGVLVASSATTETIAALDKAKDDIVRALEESAAEPGQSADDAEEDEDQLYVVEERLIRGRPARVLSDGTVEAETDEGWMRFENREHLEEYLDAMSPDRS
jgi:hypothetical protein